jgi:3',5'-cyclic-AMP phosphodiesterase
MRGPALAVAALGLASALLLHSCSLGEWLDPSEPVEERFREASDRSPPALDQASLADGFAFIVGTDIHFGKGDGEPRRAALDAFAMIAKEEDARFALFAGDSTDDGEESEFDSMVAFADSLQRRDGSALPWYAVVGNHDLFNGGWSHYRKLVGPSYAIIPCGPVDIYLLDSASGTLGNSQLDRLRADMKADPLPKITLTHTPIIGSGDGVYIRLPNPLERAIILDLFAASDVRLMLNGHTHAYGEASLGDLREITIGSLVDANDGLAHCLVVQVDGAGAISSIKSMDF